MTFIKEISLHLAKSIFIKRLKSEWQQQQEESRKCLQ